MSYLESLQRGANYVTASLKVSWDKTFDYFSSDSEKGKISRMYPKDLITEYKTFFTEPTEIYPTLFPDANQKNNVKIYLGSAINAANPDTLTDKKIKYIINVSAEISDYDPQNYVYYRVPIRDNNKDSIKKYLDDCVAKINEFIKNNNGNILIHCYMGASRSVTVLAYYISKQTNKSMSEIIAVMKDARKNINPTNQFIDDLESTKCINMDDLENI